MWLVCVVVILLLPLAAVAAVAEVIDPERFEKEIVVAACNDPMQLEVLSDGRVLFIERAGAVKLYSPVNGRVTTIGQVPVELYCEVGLLGLSAAQDFDQSGQIYLFFCPKDHPDLMRLARFTIRDGLLQTDSEVKLFEYTIDQGVGCNHQGGGLARGPDGCLYIGTGDNSYPIPEVPIDQRPGQEKCDALRTSANSQSLRGKILRILPRPGGTYEIPPGNLFPDGKQGRPEIYCMGIRNAFRLSVDAQNGWLYWGDVGPNVNPEFKLGPEGYDEFNQARRAGNFGWPMFTGPNEAFRHFDFQTRQVGKLFDAHAPINESRNNTGLKELPPAVGALVWYPTSETTHFPDMGSGGRSAMAGPIYYDQPGFDSIRKLPLEYDGALLAFDWMRSWIKLIRLDQSGGFKSLEPFAPLLTFRRPIDLKIGPDGMVYIIEFGDKWNGNTDSQIVRVSYRRGNRDPIARIEANPVAGRQPLKVNLDGSKSLDRDSDALEYEWRVAGESTPRARGPRATVQFDQPGTYQVRLSVRDTHGATGTAEQQLEIGNAPPALQITSPLDGSFFDWDEPICYQVLVDDFEEGSTTNGRIAPARVIARTELRVRTRPEAEDNPGLALMRKSNCFGCHSATVGSAGPPYAAVAFKYKSDPEARERLARKVLTGGTGVWGKHQMPPQSQLKLEQARMAIDWVLASGDAASHFVEGDDGVVMPPPLPKSADDLSRHFVITATMTDNGADGRPPITVEESVTLHSRRQRAAFGSGITGGVVVDELEKGERLIVQLKANGLVDFGRIDLTGIDRMTVRAHASSDGALDVRSNGPRGTILGRFDFSATKAFTEQTGSLAANVGRIESLCLVARDPISINWIEFHESDAAKVQRMRRATLARERQTVFASLNLPRTHVKKWSVSDVMPEVGRVDSDRSLERGWAVFRQAGCINCHRLGGLGGDMGPNLSDVAKRLASQAQPRTRLLQELLEPSRIVAEEFKPIDVITTDGLQYHGMLVNQDETVVRVRPLPPAPQDIKEIRRTEIDELSRSNLSPMPEGLLDVLSLEEILDLMALLEFSANPKSPAFQKQ